VRQVAVAYSVLEFQAQPAGAPGSSFVWDVANPGRPEAELAPASPLVCLAFNLKARRWPGACRRARAPRAAAAAALRGVAAGMFVTFAVTLADESGLPMTAEGSRHAARARGRAPQRAARLRRRTRAWWAPGATTGSLRFLTCAAARPPRTPAPSSTATGVPLLPADTPVGTTVLCQPGCQPGSHVVEPARGGPMWSG